MGHELDNAIHNLQRAITASQQPPKKNRRHKPPFAKSKQHQQHDRRQALDKANAIMAELNRRYPQSGRKSSHGNLAKASADIDGLIAALEAVIAAEGGREDHKSSTAPPKVSALKKSYRERTLMENIAVQSGIDPDLPFVNKARSIDQLKRLSRVQNLENIMSVALGVGGDERGIFRQLAAIYGIPADSPLLRRVQPSEGAAGLRRAKLVEMLEGLRDEVDRLDCSEWLDSLLDSVKSFR